MNPPIDAPGTAPPFDDVVGTVGGAVIGTVEVVLVDGTPDGVDDAEDG